MKKFFRILSVILVMTMGLTIVPATSVSAATDSSKAKSMKLDSTEGTVTVENAKGVAKKTRAGMILLSGDVIKTSDKSYAYILLDSTKAVKVDENSEVKIKKNGLSLELTLVEGKLYFDVSKPLTSKESLTIRTSNMVCGVRGTIGVVETSAKTKESSIYLFEGKVEITGRLPQVKGSVFVNAGEKITVEKIKTSKKKVKLINFVEKGAIENRDIEPWIIERISAKKTSKRIKKAVDLDWDYILNRSKLPTYVIDKSESISELLGDEKVNGLFSGNIKITSKGSLTVDVPVNVRGDIEVEAKGKLNINEPLFVNSIESMGDILCGKTRIEVGDLLLNSGSFNINGQLIAENIKVENVNVTGGLDSADTYVKTHTKLENTRFSNGGVQNYVCEDGDGYKYYGMNNCYITIPMLEEIKRGNKNIEINPGNEISLNSEASGVNIIELDDVKITGKHIGIVNEAKTYVRITYDKLADTVCLLKAGKWRYQVGADKKNLELTSTLISDATEKSADLEIPKSKSGIVARVSGKVSLSGVNLALNNNGIMVGSKATLTVSKSEISGSGCESIGNMIVLEDTTSYLSLDNSRIVCTTSSNIIKGIIDSPVVEVVETYSYKDGSTKVPVYGYQGPTPGSTGYMRSDNGASVDPNDVHRDPAGGLYILIDNYVSGTYTYKKGGVGMTNSEIIFTGPNAKDYKIADITEDKVKPDVNKDGNTVVIRQ